MIRSLVIAGCLIMAACGTVEGEREAGLDQGPVGNGVVKRTAVIAITVPEGARTEGFDDDPRTLSDGAGQIIRGDGYRISIDFSDRSVDPASGQALTLSNRQAHVTKTRAGDGSETGQVSFPSKVSSSRTMPPTIDWQCARRDVCLIAERSISSLRISWDRLQGTAPPPEAPPQAGPRDATLPPPANARG